MAIELRDMDGIAGKCRSTLASGAKTIENFRAFECSHLIVIGALAMVVIADAVFLYWIQRKLEKAREYLSKADVEMRNMLGASAQPHVRSIWMQVPMYVEFGITVLLTCVLFVVFKYSAG